MAFAMRIRRKSLLYKGLRRRGGGPPVVSPLVVRVYVDSLYNVENHIGGVSIASIDTPD